MPNKTITDHSETIIGIHLDFKYLMPNKKYLLAWIRRLPEMGINTLWIEYEDKFPYRQYPFIQVRDGLTPDEVRALVDTAHEVGLRVIPTVQSLSHLEFALGRPELAHLREREDIPTQICPCNPAAITLLQNLIDDILSYHEADDWIHLGADEAWALGTCPKCAARAGDDVLAFRLEHTRMICEYVRRKGKRPLISDDMFWGVPERSAELPKDVILGAWNYGATRFDSTGNLARQVAVYQRQGHQVISHPCANWGVVFPRHETLDNTMVHAELNRREKTLGVINTAWTVFLIPPPAWQMRIAATGDLFSGKIDKITTEWERHYLEKEFATDCEGIPEALANLGELWEVEVKGEGRPLTPMLFGCMDMVLAYPGGQEERKRRGQYPIELETIDFNEVHRKKVEKLKKIPDFPALITKLDDVLNTYPASTARLQGLAAAAKQHQDEAKLLAALAELKLVSARIFDLSVRGRGNRAALQEALAACGRELRLRLAKFYEKASVERWLRMMWQPQMTMLNETE